MAPAAIPETRITQSMEIKTFAAFSSRKRTKLPVLERIFRNVRGEEAGFAATCTEGFSRAVAEKPVIIGFFSFLSFREVFVRSETQAVKRFALLLKPFLYFLLS